MKKIYFSVCQQDIFHIPLCTVPSKNKQRLIKIGSTQNYTTSLHNLAFCKGEKFSWNIATIVLVSQKPGRNNEKENNKNHDKSLLHPHLYRLLLRVGAGLLGGQGCVWEPQRLWREPSIPQVKYWSLIGWWLIILRWLKFGWLMVVILWYDWLIPLLNSHLLMLIILSCY